VVEDSQQGLDTAPTLLSAQACGPRAPRFFRFLFRIVFWTVVTLVLFVWLLGLLAEMGIPSRIGDACTFLAAGAAAVASALGIRIAVASSPWEEP
jgi:hypothetical protein